MRWFAAELEKFNLPSDDIVISGDNKEIGVARFKDVLSKSEIADLKLHIKEKFGAEPNVSSVTPTVGKEIAKNALIGLLITSLGLIVFVSFRFELPMAVSAVIALLFAAFYYYSIL